MPDTQGNIFLTMENLAFAMPLILLCTIYAFFKYIPLQYGLPAVGVVIIGVQIRSQMEAQRVKKFEKLDENTILDLIGDTDKENKNDAAAAQEQVKKQKVRIQQRLAQERKVEAKKAAAAASKKGGKKNSNDDDDNDDDLATFAKSSSTSNNTKQKRK